MILFFTLLMAVAATKKTTFDTEPHSSLVAVVKRSEEIITKYTKMSILATKLFENQVHILVDSIRDESGTAFVEEMSKLANNTHISLVSRNSSALWPPTSNSNAYLNDEIIDNSEKMQKTPSQRPTELSARKRVAHLEDKRLIPYDKEHCNGNELPTDVVVSGGCQKFSREGANSAFIFNDSEYNMHVAVYEGENCEPERRKIYYWHPKRAIVCYAITDGDSIWWEESGKDVAPGLR